MFTKASFSGTRVVATFVGVCFVFLVAPGSYGAESDQAAVSGAPAKVETPPAAAPEVTTEATAEPQLPNVDHLLDDNSITNIPVASSGDLRGNITKNEISNETAMVPVPPTARPVVEKSAPPAKALPPLTQVKLSYKQGKYFDALKVLATMKPTELTHYYAGLCYQGQGQLQKAASEFTYVASMAKDPLVRYNAQNALQAVSSYAKSRTYAGQGNVFARAPVGGGRGGGGGVRRG